MLATVLGAILALGGAPARALNIVFDYSLDAQHFFSADKRAVLDQVASIFENNISTHMAALNNVNFSSAGLPSATNPMTGLPSAYYAGSALSASHLNVAADNPGGLCWRRGPARRTGRACLGRHRPGEPPRYRER